MTKTKKQLQKKKWYMIGSSLKKISQSKKETADSTLEQPAPIPNLPEQLEPAPTPESPTSSSDEDFAFTHVRNKRKKGKKGKKNR